MKKQKEQVNTTETKQIGRPANPNSARQKKIQERLAKKEAGMLKRGRPVIEGSKRQEVIKKRNEKVSMGIELKKGRPVNPESKRQAAIAKKANEVVSE